MVDIAKLEKLMILMSKHGFDVVQAESAGEKFSLAKNASHAHVFQQHAHFGASSSSNQSYASHASPESLEEAPTTTAAPAPIVAEEKKTSRRYYHEPVCRNVLPFS